MTDDIVIVGSTEEEPDPSLTKVIQRFSERALTVVGIFISPEKPSLFLRFVKE